jgi:hypothetical protein
MTNTTSGIGVSMTAPQYSADGLSWGSTPRSALTLKHNTMRKALLTQALVASLITSLIGLTQVQSWTHLAMFTFGAFMSLGMIGLLATEK